MMENLSDYYGSMQEKEQFLVNHSQLLHSLLLSKQNAGNQPSHQNPEGLGNGTVESSEGIGGASGGDAA